MLKRKIIGLFLLPLLLVTIVGSILLPASQVSAAGNGSIIIKLNPNRTDVTVTADREEAVGGGAAYNSIKLKYNSGKQQWETGDIPLTNGGGGCAEYKFNMFRITVKDNNGAALQTGGPYYAACGTQVNKTLTVPPSTGGGTGKNGGIQGQLYLYDPNINRTALENPSSCTITMQSLTAGNPDGKVSKTYSNACGKDGKYIIPLSPGLPAGVYKFEAQGGYANPNGNNHVIDIVDTAVIEAGKMATLNIGEDFTDPSHPQTKILSDLQALTVVKPICGLGQSTCDTGGGKGDGTQKPTCESTGFSFSWLVCGAINLLSTAVDGMETLVRNALTVPVIQATKSDGSPTEQYQIWSNFRVYGDIFLVILLLVIVFGEAIGGGLIDAYTAKKALPRVLIGAVLINLSFYIVAALVDITNVVGKGIGDIMLVPFKLHTDFAIHIPGATSLLAVLGTGAAIWALHGLIASLAGLLVMFVLLPALFIFIAIIVTVLLRIAFIYILVVVAPFAFSLWALPNTEKYFRQWWDALFKTLLVYPIISVFFAMGNILGIIINTTNPFGGFTVPLSVLAIIAPLAAIPLAFRLAGGILGRGHEFMNGMGKRAHQGILGNPNDPNSMRNVRKRRVGDAMVRRREQTVGGFNARQKNSKNRFVRAGAGILGRAANYGDLEAKRSALTKQEAELRELKTGYGPDSSVRAFFAQKDANGNWISGTTGKQFSSIDVAKSNQVYGKSISTAQSAIDYELGKAEPHQYEQMVSDAAGILTRKGYSDEEVKGIMTGVGYKNQGKYLDLKHSSFTRNKETGVWSRTIDHAAMAQNAAVDFGSYPISNMKPAPITKLAEAHRQAEAALALPANASEADFEALGFKTTADGIGPRQLAERTRDDVESTAATLDMSRRRAGGTVAEAGEGGEASPIASSGAPGRVDVEIQKLVQQTSASRARRLGNGGS